MRYKKLGQTNIEISSIGLGCMGMSIAYGKPDDKEIGPCSVYEPALSV